MTENLIGDRERRPATGGPRLPRSMWLPQLCVVAVVLLLLPASGRQLPGTTSFVPALVALVGCFDLLCAVLLIVQFLDVGDRRALALSWAYVSSLVLLGGYAAASPA